MRTNRDGLQLESTASNTHTIFSGSSRGTGMTLLVVDQKWRTG